MVELIEFLKSTVGMDLLGLALLILAFDYVKTGISGRTKGLLKVMGIALVAYAALSYSGVQFTLDENQPAATVSGFDVIGSDSHSYITVDQEGKSFTWNTAYDHTADAIVGADQATLTFSISRGLGTVGLVQTSTDVVSVSEVTNDTTDINTPILSKTGTQYNAIWTRSDGSTGIETITVTIAEDADGASVSLNLTLSQGAVRSMALYGTAIIHLDIAGQPWTVSVLEIG